MPRRVGIHIDRSWSDADRARDRDGVSAELTQAAIRALLIADFPIVIPDSKEMPEIEGHIRIETSKFDDLVNDAEAAICLLKERRSALIAAAVTGKIDVRGFVEQEAA